MRVGIYARVSTAEQDTGLQLAELREYAGRRGWSVVEFVDHGVSGSKDSRPALNDLMNAARQRKIDCVLVWKLDRWGRSLKHLINSLAELESVGVAFVSLRDNLDLTTASGRLMFAVIGAMAEFERSLIRERSIAGQQHARAKGKRIGRPRVALDTARIERLRAGGASYRAIARELGVSDFTVRAACEKSPAESVAASC